jgi:hypothetical protein
MAKSKGLQRDLEKILGVPVRRVARASLKRDWATVKAELEKARIEPADHRKFWDMLLNGTSVAEVIKAARAHVRSRRKPVEAAPKPSTFNVRSSAAVSGSSGRGKTLKVKLHHIRRKPQILKVHLTQAPPIERLAVVSAEPEPQEEESPLKPWREIMVERIREMQCSLGDLATESGVDAGVLSRFIRGERSITLDTAERLCGAIGLRLTE